MADSRSHNCADFRAPILRVSADAKRKITVLRAFGHRIFKFRESITFWLKRIKEVELGDGKLNFKIGKDEVSLPDLDVVITDRLRELQEQIESIRKDMTAEEVAVEQEQTNADNEIPKGLEALLVKQVYPKLKSKLWLGRYVQTLRKESSVSEDLMLKFCRSQNDIEVFKDGDRWVAALKGRTRP
jgi:hypothetical protein